MSRLPCTAPVAGQTVPGETENGIGGCTTAGNRRLDSRAVEQAIDARVAEKEVERECRLPTSRLRVLNEESLRVCVVAVAYMHRHTAVRSEDQASRRASILPLFLFPLSRLRAAGCPLRLSICKGTSARVHSADAHRPSPPVRPPGAPGQLTLVTNCQYLSILQD